MSISLMGVMLGLPCAGNAWNYGKKFEQWIESKDYLLYTTFDSWRRCGEILKRLDMM